MAGVDLYWLPLGAGGHFVRLNGRVYETLAARLQQRPTRDLYHSALQVELPEETFVIEQAPVHDWSGKKRGVVAEGAVGARWAGRFRIFRYEIRLWRGGNIPDVAEAADSPRRLAEDEAKARRLLDAVPQVPTAVWGRDEFSLGEMWNSNSVIAWSLERAGFDAESIPPPVGGRAPGWRAGVALARDTHTPRLPQLPGSTTAKPRSTSEDSASHAGVPRPSWDVLAREIAEVGVALPRFAASPLFRRWHRKWGATDGEVAAWMPGDGLVPHCQCVCTRAITIHATPQQVWPWLVQIGFGKAGFYSYDLLDNAGRPSAERILEQFQHAGVGDIVPMASKVTDKTAFKIALIEPPDTLLWAKPDSTWAWRLAEADGQTRLVTRLRARYDIRRPGNALLSVLLMEIGDYPMMRRMLLGIRRRAEAGVSG